MTILTDNRTERPFAVDCVIREVLTRDAKDGLAPGGPQSAAAIGCYVAEVPLALTSGDRGGWDFLFGVTREPHHPLASRFRRWGFEGWLRD